jgi:hypothetical protein
MQQNRLQLFPVHILIRLSNIILLQLNGIFLKQVEICCYLELLLCYVSGDYKYLLHF